MISENNEKSKMNYKNNSNNNQSNKKKFKENFYSMSEANTYITEPNLEVLPFA